MNQSDEQIDKVLRGLRDVRTDDLLQLRVMERLREAQRESSPARRHWLLSWRVAGLGAVVCAVMVLGVVMLRPVGTHSQADRASVPQKKVPLMLEHDIAPVITGHVPNLRNLVRVTPQHKEKAGATVDSRVQGFPAPPMPLTEQERLLVRLAHRDDPVQLAQLSAPERAARFEAEKQQVQEFFAQPVPPDTTTMESGGGTE